MELQIQTKKPSSPLPYYLTFYIGDDLLSDICPELTIDASALENVLQGNLSLLAKGNIIHFESNSTVSHPFKIKRVHIFSEGIWVDLKKWV